MAEAITSKAGPEIDKRKVSLGTEIKSFGTYECEVKLYTGISAKLFVLVCSEE